MPIPIGIPLQKIIAAIIALLLLLIPKPDLFAADNSYYRVGVKVSAPFVETVNDKYTGDAIDVWESTYSHNEYIEYPTVDAMMKALQANEIDVAVGSISMTAEREAVVDFLHPFYKTGLTYAAPVRSSVFDVWLSVLPTIAFGIFIIFLVNAVAGAFFALVEHKANDTVETKWSSIFTGVYWSSATLTTVGYGDVSARTPIGRFFSTIWMWSGLVITGMMMALVVSAVSVNENSVADFNLLKSEVAVIDGSAGSHYVANVVKSRNVQTFKSLNSAVEALRNGRVDGIVHDKALLDHVIGSDDTLYVSDDLFNDDYYAFAVQEDSDLQEFLNQRMLVSKEL